MYCQQTRRMLRRSVLLSHGRIHLRGCATPLPEFTSQRWQVQLFSVGAVDCKLAPSYKPCIFSRMRLQ